MTEQKAKAIRKKERERIIRDIENKYLGGDLGVSKNYSKTARYAVAKEIVLGLRLEEILKPRNDKRVAKS